MRSFFGFRSYLVLTNLLFVCIQVFAQNAEQHQKCHFSVSGYVMDAATNIPLANANIWVKDLQKGTSTDENGFFELKNLCSGNYHIRFSHISCETENKYFKLEKDTLLSVRLEHHAELLHEVEVQTEEELATSVVNTISKQEITSQSNKNLADILENIVGVSTLKNGSGLSKPVVHGLYGNRVAILNQGVVQSGQQWGNDHAPEIDAFSADYLSVVKGAAALQYSGNALGSIIQVESSPISSDPHLHGQINYIFQSNGFGHTLNTKLEKQGSWAAWRLTGTLKMRGDLKAPNYFLTNTGQNEQNISFNLQKNIGKNLSLKAHYSLFNTEIGILRGSHIGNLTDLRSAIGRETPFFVKDDFSYEINAPRQKVSHHLLKLEGIYFLNDKSSIELRYGGQINDREEYDVRRGGRSNRPSLSLLQSSQFVEGVYQYDLSDEQNVKIGLQNTFVLNDNNPETGILPLIPDYNNNTTSFFGIFEKKSEKLSYQFGGRYDLRQLEAITISQDLPRRIERFDHIFHQFALSGGIAKRMFSFWKSNLDIGVMQRSPEINELYSFGLHQGVSGIEEGNRDLENELSLKALFHNDFALGEQLFFQNVVYAQSIRDYIFLEPQQEFRLTIRGAFPLFLYRQTDAFIYGTDMILTYEPNSSLRLNAKYAIVRGIDRTQNQPLVYIPSDNLSTSVLYAFGEGNKRKNTSLSIEGRYVFEQTRLEEEQDFLAPPEAYFLLNAKAKTSFLLGKSNLDIYISSENILNNTYRDYLNRQRYFADEMGFTVNVGVNYRF